jgi:hypothetical protein
MTDAIVLNLKDQDVIKISSAREDLNGYFLIDKITNEQIHLKQPQKKIMLEIEDGRIKEVDTVTLVYTSIPVGYAQTREFLPNKRVTISFTGHDEQFNGLILTLEKDRIEVLLDNEKTIYIDFKYTTVPSFISYIDIEDDYVFEEGQYFFLPDSQHRFTLDVQLTDLMDALLSKKQTPQLIQSAIRTVKRFREVLHLFSTDKHERINISDKQVIHPYDVKWIVPITKTLNRLILLETDEKNDSKEYVDELIAIQSQQSFNANYKKILETMNPFTVESGATTIATNTFPLLLKKGKYYKEPLKKGKNKLSKKTQKLVLTKEWILQVLTQPYEGSFSTIPERTTIDSYMKQPEYMIDYTRGYVPGTTLTEKVNSNFIAPFSKIAEGNIHATIAESVPPLETILHTLTPFYSVQPYVKRAIPFLIYKNNIEIDKATQVFKTVQANISSYTKLYDQPPYTPNPLVEVDTFSASEWQVRLLHGDNGTGHALQRSKQFKLILQDSGLFKLKDNVSNLHSGYKTQADYEKVIDMYERQNKRKMQGLVRIQKNREKYISVSALKQDVETSPKMPLLMYILQKPYVERYTELKEFVRRNTRPAFKLEDAEWFYCKVTNLKLLPKLFSVLIDAFENDTYANTLRILSSEKKLQSDGSILSIYGFPVSELHAEDRYEDVVRSSELVDDDLYEYRDENPMAESVSMILIYIGQLLKVDLSKYMNLMIYEIVQEKEKEAMIVYSIAIVLKVCNVVGQIDMTDALKFIMSKSVRVSAYIRKIKGFMELPLNDAHIRKAIAILSKRPSIQRLEIKKGKQTRAEKTDSTLWPTFLPPLLHLSKRPLDVPTQIIYDIQEAVKDEPTLDHFSRVNTIPTVFLRDRSILLRIPPKIRPYYNVNVKFDSYSSVLQHPEKEQFTLLHVDRPNSIPPRFVDYATKLGALTKDRIEKVPIIFENGEYVSTLPYIRAFIQNIARTFPNIILNKVTSTTIPLSIKDLISGVHHENLFRKLEGQYQFINNLKGYGPEVLKQIIEDRDIAEILQNLKGTTNEDSFIEYEYYILFIYDKYKMYDERTNKQYVQTTELLNAFTKTFKSNDVLLTYEEIQKYVLKTKAVESGGIVEMRNKMTSSDRHIFDFRQSQNISVDAQIGRTREYDSRRYDAESTWAAEHADEADLGEDGNNEAENNDEGE